LPLYKAANDEVNGIGAVRELLRVNPTTGSRFLVQPRCVEFIKEVQNYVGEEWATRAGERNKKEKARAKNNHHMDGFKYFALSPHGYIRPRWQRQIVRPQINSVTGFPVRVGA